MDPTDTLSGEDLAADSRAGREVAELMEHPGWEVLMRVVSDHRQALTDVLVTMNPSAEAAKYADRCGQIRGVGSLEGMAHEIVEVGQLADQTIEIRESQE
jgi:hypothetical protein